jgi:hypothetical protein
MWTDDFEKRRDRRCSPQNVDCMGEYPRVLKFTFVPRRRSYILVRSSKTGIKVARTERASFLVSHLLDIHTARRLLHSIQDSARDNAAGY